MATAAPPGVDLRLAGSGLQASHVAKRFGPTQALRDCSITLRPGEVLAVMGENGSGKSTLVKLLSGVHKTDAGEIQIDGRVVPVISSPRAALRLGIATVFQEVLVAPQRSVLSNVWLGVDNLIRPARPTCDKQSIARSVLTELLGEAPPLDAPLGRLSLSSRQACCIARALVRESRILILDEATSALDVGARTNLFRVVRRLRERGTSVLFISHRMDEIEEIADRITVLRSGATVGTVNRGEATAAQLVRLMTGSGHLRGSASRLERPLGPRTEAVLRVRGLTTRQLSRGITVDFHAGEITGVAGLEGHGQDDFLRALAGRSARQGLVVRVDTDGREHPVTSPARATVLGIIYIPRDRRDESIFESRSILENLALPTIALDRQSGIIRKLRSRRRLAGHLRQLRIVLANDRDEITTLSGGNQQKVIIARWLALHPKILLLNDPTRGVDIGAKRDIYRVLGEAAQAGCAIVMLSTEVGEHLELMDRVLVFRDGELHAEIAAAKLSREGLVASFFGRDEPE